MSQPPAIASVFTQARELATKNDVVGLDALFAACLPTDRQALADMALIGATQSTPCKEAGKWAIKHGATELWGIQQPEPLWRKVGNDTNRGLRMLGGPGEVSKGTFAGK